MTSPIAARSGGPPAVAPSTAPTSSKYSGPNTPGGDGEELRVARGAVLERVRRAARDEDDPTRVQLATFAVDRERRDAGEAVVDLLEAVVAVRRRHHGVGGDVALEGGRAAAGSLCVEHECDGEGADADRV
jgi:hypothetical protein